jgi:hypothetical protein
MAKELEKNGLPTDNKKTEVVGKMDHIFYLPKEAIKAQKNELVIHLSAHNGYNDLSSPMHFITLATYGDSKRFI